MKKNNFKAFTLSEVLIAILVIGVVAIITLSPIITNIQNKGYVERMKKAYALIQNVTNQVIEEEGAPNSWASNENDSSQINIKNASVFEKYASKINYTHKCMKNYYQETPCTLKSDGYRTLNNKNITRECMEIYKGYYSLNLSDGSMIGLNFRRSSNSMCWTAPNLTFVVDVNGKKKPNKIGRDIFYFYLKYNENGKVHPFDYNNIEDDCNKDGAGFSCSKKIFIEGKMNY